jgi:hypothetical protein
MADIFISYASQDRAVAERLAAALAGEGWSVWWDRTIPPGKTFAKMIEDALAATKCVVVLWSKASKESNWVHKEARFGDKRGVLIPALIEDVDPPFEFDHIQAASLMAWDGDTSHAGYLQLVAAISDLAGPPPKLEEEAKRKAEEEDAAQKKAEADAKRKAEQEAARKKAEEEAERKAKEDAGRKKVEADTPPAGGLAAERPKAKKAKLIWIMAAVVLVLVVAGVGVAVNQRGGEPESERIVAEQEAERKAEEEAAQKRAEAERERKAEEEDARRKAEQKAEKRKAKEEAAQKRAEEEAAQKRAEEEEAKRIAEEEARKRAEPVVEVSSSTLWSE